MFHIYLFSGLCFINTHKKLEKRALKNLDQALWWLWSNFCIECTVICFLSKYSYRIKKPNIAQWPHLPLCTLGHSVWHKKSDNFLKFTSKCLVELEHIAAWQLFFAIGDWNSFVKLLIFGQRLTSLRKIAFFRSKWFVLTLPIRFCTLCPFLRVDCVLNVRAAHTKLSVCSKGRLWKEAFMLLSTLLLSPWISLCIMNRFEHHVLQKCKSQNHFVMVFHWSSL